MLLALQQLLTTLILLLLLLLQLLTTLILLLLLLLLLLIILIPLLLVLLLMLLLLITTNNYTLNILLFSNRLHVQLSMPNIIVLWVISSLVDLYFYQLQSWIKQTPSRPYYIFYFSSGNGTLDNIVNTAATDCNSPITEKRSELTYHWEEVSTHLSLRRGQNSPITDKRSELTYQWEEVRTHLSLRRGQNSPLIEKRSKLTYHWEEVRTHLSLRRGQNSPIIEKRSEWYTDSDLWLSLAFPLYNILDTARPK